MGRDVTLGEADPEELMATDLDPVRGTPVADLVATVRDSEAAKKDRRRATLALGDAERAEPIVTTLARAAATDDDADVRQFAVESLGKLGGDRAAEVAVALLRDEDPWVRAEALVTLDRLDREAHEDRIESALRDDHHGVRRNALISLFKRRGEASLPVLLRGADDDSERVREWAAHMLGGVDDDDARRALERLATEDDSDIVRETAKHAYAVDPHRFRRNFGGALQGGDVTLSGEDMLNRQPRL